MSGAPVVVVGDALLDRDLEGVAERVARDGPILVVDDPEEHMRPGGAGLAALLAARQGAQVVLVTALSTDAGGSRLGRMLAAEGVTVIDIGLAGATPEKVRIASGGRVLLRLDRGSRRPAPVGAPSAEALAAIDSAGALLVSDYGGNVARSGALRKALSLGAEAAPLVWDPDPRGCDPVAGTFIVTPNVAEAAHLAGAPPGVDVAQLVAQARLLIARWRLAGVAVTRGDRGALLVASSGSVTTAPATAVPGDCCGAGDGFAAALAAQLAGGAAVDDAVTAAVSAASRFVAAGGVATLNRRPAAASNDHSSSVVAASTISPVAARVRAAGGIVVATGGCFDLLHAGHVSVLSGARALGDCLVVCLNSDQSVRALKGPGRPVVREADRASLLRALPWVDDVIIFGEPSPVSLLRSLRPDIWAKGGDYAIDQLPEATTIASWGGQVVTLPFLHGQSTTRLVEQGR